MWRILRWLRSCVSKQYVRVEDDIDTALPIDIDTAVAFEDDVI